MAQPVTVYRWDDVGAPQVIDGKPSEYMNVFKKCLVEGYGSKAPVGWTVEDESLPEETPFLAIKNDELKGGSGGAMTFKAQNDNAITVITCQSALDYISKTEQSRVGAYFTIGAGSTGVHSANKWIIIASATAFYFLALPEYTMNRNYFGTYAHIMFFAGDIKSFYGADPARFVSLSGSINSNSFAWNGGLNNIISDNYSSICGYMYALDASANKASGYIVSSFGIHAVGQNSIQDSTPEIRVLSPTLLCSGSYNLSAAGSNINSETLPFARGEIPGLFISQEYGYRIEKMPFIKLIDGVSHFSIPRSNNGGTCAWINLEEWG